MSELSLESLGLTEDDFKDKPSAPLSLEELGLSESDFEAPTVKPFVPLPPVAPIVPIMPLSPVVKPKKLTSVQAGQTFLANDPNKVPLAPAFPEKVIPLSATVMSDLEFLDAYRKANPQPSGKLFSGDVPSGVGEALYGTYKAIKSATYKANESKALLEYHRLTNMAVKQKSPVEALRVFNKSIQALKSKKWDVPLTQDERTSLLNSITAWSVIVDSGRTDVYLPKEIIASYAKLDPKGAESLKKTNLELAYATGQQRSEEFKVSGREKLASVNIPDILEEKSFQAKDALLNKAKDYIASYGFTLDKKPGILTELTPWQKGQVPAPAGYNSWTPQQKARWQQAIKDQENAAATRAISKKSEKAATTGLSIAAAGITQIPFIGESLLNAEDLQVDPTVYAGASLTAQIPQFMWGGEAAAKLASKIKIPEKILNSSKVARALANTSTTAEGIIGSLKPGVRETLSSLMVNTGIPLEGALGRAIAGEKVDPEQLKNEIIHMNVVGGLSHAVTSKITPLLNNISSKVGREVAKGGTGATMGVLTNMALQMNPELMTYENALFGVLGAVGAVQADRSRIAVKRQVVKDTAGYVRFAEITKPEIERRIAELQADPTKAMEGETIEGLQQNLEALTVNSAAAKERLKTFDKKTVQEIVDEDPYLGFFIADDPAVYAASLEAKKKASLGDSYGWEERYKQEVGEYVPFNNAYDVTKFEVEQRIKNGERVGMQTLTLYPDLAVKYAKMENVKADAPPNAPTYFTDLLDLMRKSSVTAAPESGDPNTVPSILRVKPEEKPIDVPTVQIMESVMENINNHFPMSDVSKTSKGFVVVHEDGTGLKIEWNAKNKNWDIRDHNNKPVNGIDANMIKKAMPTALRVTQLEDGSFEVQMMYNKFRFKNPDKINAEGLAEHEYANGMFDIVDADGKKIIDTDGVISIARGTAEKPFNIGTDRTLYHEVAHAAFKMGAITEKEYGALLKKYGNEEKIAIAYENWNDKPDATSVFAKIKRFFQNLVSRIFTPNNAAVEKIFRQLRSGEVWTRKPKPFDMQKVEGRVAEDGKKKTATKLSVKSEEDDPYNHIVTSFAGKTETAREFIERHELKQEGDYVVLYHATPKTTKLNGYVRAFSYLDNNPERAIHFAGRDRGLGPDKIVVHKVLVAPNELEYSGHFLSNTDIPLNRKSTDPLKQGSNNNATRYSIKSTNSLGKPIAQDEKSIENFNRWFGDSKVVDEQGRPLVVYHGTPKDFNAFDNKKSNRTDRAASRFLGFFFTDDKVDANRYAKWNGADGKTMELYLSVKNPYKMTHGEHDALNMYTFNKMKESNFKYTEADKKQWDKEEKANVIKIKKDLINEGYDGITIVDRRGNVLEYVAFTDTQIKSINNTGAFSGENSDIRYSIKKTYKQLFGEEITKESEDIAMSLVNAKQMLEQGKTMREIRVATGWFKGYTDNKWKRLIEHDMKIKEGALKDNKNSVDYYILGSLSEAIDYPELFKYYPDSKSIYVDIEIEKRFGGSGSFNGSVIKISAPNIKEAESVLLHEIQHFIQRKEGFSEGTNAAASFNYMDYYRSDGEREARLVQHLSDGNKDLSMNALIRKVELRDPYSNKSKVERNIKYLKENNVEIDNDGFAKLYMYDAMRTLYPDAKYKIDKTGYPTGYLGVTAESIAKYFDNAEMKYIHQMKVPVESLTIASKEKGLIHAVATKGVDIAPYDMDVVRYSKNVEKSKATEYDYKETMNKVLLDWDVAKGGKPPYVATTLDGKQMVAMDKPIDYRAAFGGKDFLFYKFDHDNKKVTMMLPEMKNGYAYFDGKRYSKAVEPTIKDQLNNINKYIRESKIYGKGRIAKITQAVQNNFPDYDLVNIKITNDGYAIHYPQDNNSIQKRIQQDQKVINRQFFIEDFKNGKVEFLTKNIIEDKYPNLFVTSTKGMGSNSFYITDAAGEKLIKISDHNTIGQKEKYDTPFINITGMENVNELVSFIDNTIKNKYPEMNNFTAKLSKAKEGDKAVSEYLKEGYKKAKAPLPVPMPRTLDSKGRVVPPPPQDEVLAVTSMGNSKQIATTFGPGVPDNEVYTLSDIIKTMNEIGLKSRKGGFRVKNAAGIFKPFVDVIRIKKPGDIPTMIHENAHYFHSLVIGMNGRNLRPIPATFAAELDPLAYPGAKDATAEGFAEWMVDYIYDPAKAMSDAPNFYKWFETELSKNKELTANLQLLRKQVQSFKAQSAQQQVESTLVFNPTKPKEKSVLTGENIVIRQLFDDEIVLQQMAQMYESQTGNTLPATENPKIISALAKVSGVPSAWISKGVVDNMNKIISEPLGNIIKGMKKEDLEGFSAYLYAKEAVDYITEKGNDEVVPLPKATYEEVVKQGEAKYKDLADRIYKYQEHLLNFRVESGLISAADAAAWRAKRPHYVPLYRDVDVETGGNKASGEINRKAYSRKGSLLPVHDPIMSIIRDTYLYHAIASRNEVIKLTVDLARRLRGGGIFADKIPVPMDVQKLKLEDIISASEGSAISSLVDITKDRTLFVPGGSYNGKTNVVRLYRDGKAEFYEVAPDIFRMLTVTEPKVWGWLQKMTEYLRTGAVENPDFMSANLTRDMQALMINRTTKITPMDMIKAWKFIAGGKAPDSVWQQFNIAAGYGASLVGADRVRVKESLDNLRVPGNMRERFIRSIQKGWQSYKDFIAMTDLYAKFTHYGAQVKWADAKTRDELVQAVYEAIDQMPFQQKGEIVRKYGLNKLWAFVNSNLQGNYRDYRTLRDPKTRGMAVMRGILGLTLPAIGMYFVNKDDKDYNRLPDYIRDKILWVRTPAGVVMIPLPYMYGLLFKAIPERIVRAAYEKDPTAWDHIEQSILAQSPATPFPITAVSPEMQIAVNKTFAWTPLIPQSEQNLPRYMQAGGNTSKGAMVIGRLIATSERQTGISNPVSQLMQSPRVIDTLFKGHFGRLGGYILDVVGLAGKGALLPPQPSINLLERAPGISSWIPKEAMISKQQNAAYEDMREYEQRLIELKKGSDLAKAFTPMEYLRYGELKAKINMIAASTKAEKYIRQFDSPDFRKLMKDISYELPSKSTNINDSKRELLLYINERKNDFLDKRILDDSIIRELLNNYQSANGKQFTEEEIKTIVAKYKKGVYK